MRWRRCDPQALQDYLDGVLDDRRCRRVERHALHCRSCSERIESELSAFQAALRISMADGSAPDLRQRVLAVREPKRASSARLLLRLAPVGLAGLALFYALRPAGFRIESLGGAAIMDGVRYSVGDRLPLSGHLVVYDGAKLSLGGLTVESHAPRSEIEIQKGSGAWIVDAISGRLVVSSAKGAPKLVAQAGGTSYQPFGTRFSFGFAESGKPRLEVFGSRVRVLGDQGRTVEAGRSLEGDGEVKMVSDDPTAFAKTKPYLGRKLGADVDPDHRVPREALLPAFAVEELALAEQNAWRHPRDPRPLVRIAAVLCEQAEPGAAATVVHKAIRLDPDLKGCPDSQIWEILRETGAHQRSAKAALDLIDVLDRRGAADARYIDAWRALLLSRGQRDGADLGEKSRISAARALLKVADERDRWAIANALTDQRYSYEASLDAIRDALHLYRNIAGSISSPRLIRRKARVLAQVSEAIFRLETDSDRSLAAMGEAVALWPRAEWKANLAARYAEVATAGPNAFKLMGEAILEQPSAYVFERATLLLGVTASSKEDWDDFGEFLKHRGDAFRCVPSALAHTALFLSQIDPEAAAPYLERARAIATSEEAASEVNLPLYGAYVRWAAEDGGQPLGRQRALEIAKDSGLLRNGEYDPYSHSFFQAVGAHDLVLESLRSSGGIDDGGRSLALGTSLLALGRDRQAAETLASGLHRLGAAERRSNLYPEMLVAYSEACARHDPAKGRRIAADAIQNVLPRYTAGHMVTSLRKQSLEARAYAVLGDYRRAAALYEPFAAPWHSGHQRASAEKTLNDLKAKAAAQR